MNEKYIQLWNTTWGVTARSIQMGFGPGGVGDAVKVELDSAEAQMKEENLTEIGRETVKQDGHVLGVIYSVKTEDLEALKESGREQMIERLNDGLFEREKAQE